MTSRRKRKRERRKKAEATANPRGDWGAESVSLEDVRLAARAIREGWDIPEPTREVLIECAAGLLETGEQRKTIAGARLITEMENMNRRFPLTDEQRAKAVDTVNLDRLSRPRPL